MPSDDLVRGAFLILALMVASFGAYLVEAWFRPRLRLPEVNLPEISGNGCIKIIVISVIVCLVLGVCGLLWSLATLPT